MQHLDDGVLHALVDGEVGSADLPPIQAHLEACADCAARLESARLLAVEADHLVDTIEFPDPNRAPVASPVRPVRGGRLGRRLAWAATVALAAGLGYAGGRGAPPEAAAPTEVAMAPTVTASSPAEPPLVQPEGEAVAIPTPRQQAPGTSSEATVEARQAVPATPLPAPAPAAQLAAEENEAQTARDAGAPAMVGGVNAPSTAGRLAAEEKTADSKMAFRREAAVAFEEVTLAEAVRRLGGSLRQVEGLVPVRLEAAGATVRVVYRLADGELVLQQHRQGDSVAVRLLAPGLSPDSLARLRVRE